MSVLITVRITADAANVEAHAEKDPAMMQTIIGRAKEHGVISHHFYGTDSEVLVVDEWPSEDAFRGFFDSTPEIGQLMGAAGVTTEPQVTVWRKLDTKDDVG